MPGSPPEELFGLVHCDGDAVIESTNATLASWLNYSPDELLGQPFDTILEPSGRLFFHSQLIPNLELNHHVEELYLNFRTREGGKLPVLINACRRQKKDRVALEFAVFLIHRRARLEDELLQAKKLAQQANAAKSRFLGMISHELRTPLQSICMFVDLLLEGSTGPLTPTQEKLLVSSREAGGSLAGLIEDILEFARTESGKARVEMHEVPARAIIEQSEALFGVRIQEARIEFLNEPVPENIKVQGDPKRIQQILLNLLTNALKFTPAGGRITTRLVVDGGYACFEVEDTGSGIAAEDLARIFDAFVQAGSESDMARGLGLGLAISRDLARAMQGSLTVRSTCGVGSTFSLSLPLVSEAAQVPA